MRIRLAGAMTDIMRKHQQIRSGQYDRHRNDLQREAGQPAFRCPAEGLMGIPLANHVAKERI